MQIEDSARGHGITGAAMLHAVRVVFRIVRQADGIDMYVGADEAGRLLDVGLVDIESDEPRIVHAMPLRTKYYEYL